jgi:hypothetical protein
MAFKPFSSETVSNILSVGGVRILYVEDISFVLILLSLNSSSKMFSISS